MNEYEVTDYGIFSNGVATTKTFNGKIGDVKTVATEVKTSLSDGGVFMGPIQENCMQEFLTLDTDLTGVDSNFQILYNFLIQSSDQYKKGDGDASVLVLNQDGSITTSQASLISSGTVQGTVTIPDNINQAGYTVTCYGEGGWYLGGGVNATSIARGTNQEKVHNAWLANGGKYKNGIAVMNINGQDHYLIAVAPTFGKVGDNVSVQLKNGQTIPCVIADAKSTGDANYTKYGHGTSGGAVNVLEFEVNRNDYNSKGNPKTSTWGLEWDSSSGVSQIINYGTVI